MKLLNSLAFGVAMGLVLIVTFLFVMALVFGTLVVAASYGLLGGVMWGVVAFATFVAVTDWTMDN